jgi:hypothetical protein
VLDDNSRVAVATRVVEINPLDSWHGVPVLYEDKTPE